MSLREQWNKATENETGGMMRINIIRVVRDLTDLRNDLDTAIREHESREHVPTYLLAAEDVVRELISYLVEQGES